MKQKNLAFGLAVAAVTYHLALWAWIAYSRGIAWESLWVGWDGAWYRRIVSDGYQGQSWAFYPLYPLLVKFVAMPLEPVFVPFAGAALSTLCFAASVWLLASDAELSPRTPFGWIAFLFSPASYVFHTMHTEALYLLLAVLAWRSAARPSLPVSGLLSGLASLTRIHGVFLAVGIALQNASAGATNRAKVLRFVLSGLLSAAFFGLFPLYAWNETGNPFTPSLAQRNWAHVTDFTGAARTLWFGNPWQNTNTGTLLRHAYFAVLLVTAATLWKRSRPLSVWTMLSLLVMFMQGELVNAFRFGAVLFPVLFCLGDWVADRPRAVRVAFVGVSLLLNHFVARNYALGRWAY